MALKTIETRAVISAQDKTGATFAQVAQKLSSMQTATENASRRVNSMTARASAASESRAAGLIAGGKALVAGAAAYGAGRMIHQSVEDWADLEMAVTRLGNTGEVTNDKITDAIQNFRQLGPQMGVSAKQVAEAAEVYVAAGVDFDKAVAATPAALKAAKASGGELNDVVNAGVAGLNNLGLAVPQLDQAFDIMAKGGKLGSFELKNMAKELPGVTARAKALGLSGTDGLAQLVAMLETTRKTAATGEEAANNLVNFFDKITSPDTAKHFAKMGVNIEKELKAGAKRGENYVETTLRLVEKLTGGDEFKIQQLFNDRQAKMGIKALIDFKAFYKDTLQTLRTQSIGTNTRDFDRAMETSRSKLDKLASSWEVVRTRLGEKFGVPALQPVLDTLNRWLDRIDELEAKQKRGDDYADTPGQQKFNRFMNGVFVGGMRGSDQSVFDPSVEGAARNRRARELEDGLTERQAALKKRAEELRASVASTPFAGVKVRDTIELNKVLADLDDIGPKVENLRRLREEMSRLIAEGGPIERSLNGIRALGINQVPPMGAPTPVLGRGAMPLSLRNWNSVDPIVAHGVRAGESIIGSPEWKVSLDPASKASVEVTVKVDATSQLLNAFTAAQKVSSAGSINASIGTVGKTGVGSQGD